VRTARFSVNLGFDQCRTDVLECLLSKSFTPSERSARPWSTQLIAAIEHLHSCDVVHLDIKLENLLVDHCGRLKVCDLGLAALLPPGSLTGKLCGSGVYAAPEVLLTRTMGCYDGRAADIWSLGICIFILNRGRFPFKVKHPTELYMTFCKARATATHMGEEQLPPPLVLCSQSQRGSFSPSLCNLLDSCLALDPSSRPSANALAHHPWFRERDVEQTASEQSISKDATATKVTTHELVAQELLVVPEMGYTTPDTSPIFEARSITQLNLPKMFLDKGIPKFSKDDTALPSASHGFRRAKRGTRPTPYIRAPHAMNR
jgi:serine/threonine protein kinase